MTGPRRQTPGLVRLDDDGEVAVLRMASPILRQSLLVELCGQLEVLEDRQRPPAVVLASEHPSVFLAGADLREIADLDAASCVPYAGLGRKTVDLLESYPAPTVAAVAGSCSGGGFDISLACDLIVAGPGASFVHPGVRRGLVTGWTGTAGVPAAIGRARARSVFLTAWSLDAPTAVACGIAIPADGDPIRSGRETALRLLRLDPARRSLWRRLRSGRFVDRFRATVVHK